MPTLTPNPTPALASTFAFTSPVPLISILFSSPDGIDKSSSSLRPKDAEAAKTQKQKDAELAAIIAEKKAELARIQEHQF
jgi:hypothetical protein